MATLQELINQRDKLDAQIGDMRTAERDAAVVKVRKLMEENGLTADDLRLKSASSTKGKRAGAGTKVAPKYRNAKTGEAWSGRGLQPKWLKAALAGGKKIEEFAIT